MKKLISVFCILLAAFLVLVGCSKEPVKESESTPDFNQVTSTLVINRDNFSEDFDEEAFYETLNGIEGIFYTKNPETNEYTLRMTDAAYKKLKEIKSKDVIAEFDKLINDTENYVTDIKYDEDFRTVNVFADRKKIPEQFSDFDDTILSVMGSAMAYQIYTIEGQSVTINVIYSDNNETFKTVSFPIIIE